MQLTSSFITLLSELRCAFTAPSYLIFLDLMSGWALSHRHRYVTDLIWSSGSTQKGHHSRYHRFFSHGVWSLDVLCEMVARLLVRIFAATGLIEVAVDDSLCRKRGLTVYGAAPMALLLYSLILAWFHRVGYKHVKFPDRPWYTKKSEPSFGDALTTLRRLSCQDGFRGYLPSTGY